MPESKFLKIACPRCKTDRVIFGKSSSRIKCSNCNILLLKTQGGKAKVKAQIKKVL
jgi:small subunit ribosomal protein S27e